jgi:DNA-binding response OmpR family regulator
MSEGSADSRVLLLASGSDVSDSVSIQLGEWGFEVLCSNIADTSEEDASAAAPDILLLDVAGWSTKVVDACYRLKTLCSFPVILRAGHLDCELAAQCLEVGIDDIVFKPLDTEELVIRIDTLIRRGRRPATRRELIDNAQQSPHYADITLDGVRKVIIGARGRRRLSTTEAGLLYALLQQGPGPVERDYRCRHVLRRSWSAGDRTIDVLVSRVRRKIEEVSGELEIVAQRGIGYSLRQRDDLEL